MAAGRRPVPPVSEHRAFASLYSREPDCYAIRRGDYVALHADLHGVSLSLAVPTRPRSGRSPRCSRRPRARRVPNAKSDGAPARAPRRHP